MTELIINADQLKQCGIYFAVHVFKRESWVVVGEWRSMKKSLMAEQSLKFLLAMDVVQASENGNWYRLRPNFKRLGVPLPESS